MDRWVARSESGRYNAALGFNVVVRLAIAVDAAGFNCEDRHRGIKRGCELGKSLDPAACARHEKEGWTRSARFQFDQAGVAHTVVEKDFSLVFGNCVVHAIDIPCVRSNMVNTKTMSTASRRQVSERETIQETRKIVNRHAQSNISKKNKLRFPRSPVTQTQERRSSILDAGRANSRALP